MPPPPAGQRSHHQRPCTQVHNRKYGNQFRATHFLLQHVYEDRLVQQEALSPSQPTYSFSITQGGRCGELGEGCWGEGWWRAAAEAAVLQAAAARCVARLALTSGHWDAFRAVQAGAACWRCLQRRWWQRCPGVSSQPQLSRTLMLDAACARLPAGP